ncbi:DNA polymerase III subunit gamma/tau [Lactobacillus sp. PV037]|uniref:DNA polymerase III subunit gamma/tau n=1 Tax=Lactobacillus sp. PV037 TaxID=2594496 RepID=UPI00223F7306|nr:DNA polymerase III subunit gamma/tau [Lactobacillus sp. PV037]QNQ84083.1 DNA polymerase III subunit gamma/tau [Lactobacillus sp. PV037]
MAYQALYRKWRPRLFDDVVGQEAITDTLKNAIKRGKVSHAFLFGGPRGTGKTSCAKIFAKALNCTNLQDGEPCNECANCIAADQGAMNDIIEIDAASNNGVDEIRDIRDKVKYAPTQGKYKVYIIDEVHMLSMGAFNALLKTLEEPPEHVVFILATTELQKVPATIISRTQRYNFKRISQMDLIARMKVILKAENVSYDEKALKVIAQVADGGMRDSLSILDQILSYDQDQIKYEDTLKITGFAAQEKIETLFLQLMQTHTEDSLSLIKELLASGASSKNILNELIELSVQALLTKKGDKSHTYFLNDFASSLTEIPEEKFFKLTKLANEALNDLKYTNQQAIPLDVFSVKMTHQVKDSPQPGGEVPSEELSELQNQINSLTRQVQSLLHKSALNQTKNKDEAPRSEKTVMPQTNGVAYDNKEKIYHVLMNATKNDLVNIKESWSDVLSTFPNNKQAMVKILEPVAASNQEVVLSCKYELWFKYTNNDVELLGELEAQLAKMTQHNYKIVLVAARDWQKVRADFLSKHKAELLNKNNSERQTPKSNPVVDKAQELFGDLVNIKD